MQLETGRGGGCGVGGLWGLGVLGGGAGRGRGWRTSGEGHNAATRGLTSGNLQYLVWAASQEEAETERDSKALMQRTFCSPGQFFVSLSVPDALFIDFKTSPPAHRSARVLSPSRGPVARQNRFPVAHRFALSPESSRKERAEGNRWILRGRLSLPRDREGKHPRPPRRPRPLRRPLPQLRQLAPPLPP